MTIDQRRHPSTTNGSDRDHQQQQRQADDEQPVTRGGRALLVGVTLEQRHVHVVRLPGEVEQVAGDAGSMPIDRVDRDVEHHPQLHDPRQARGRGSARAGQW